mgnify:FL=1|tara:strand:+ start:1672 stop:1941 length:270 start_codon:yes stop_codon:yes gene_type:complete
MANLAALEALATQQTAHFYAQGTATEAREESRLLDAAIAAGMHYDHDDLHGWVAEAVGDFLTSGPSVDDFVDEDCGIARDEFGRWEYAA